MKYISFSFFLLITYNLILTTSFAQTAISSPYSRYGIGDLTSKGTGQHFAMGGTSIAMQNDTTPYFFINTGNPASFSNMRLTTAELGVKYNRVLLQSASTQKTIHSASLAYISLAFPFYKKYWGASIGLVPFSSVGYKVSDNQEISNVGRVDFLYEGTGGVNQLYLGNGIKPLAAIKKLKNKKAWEGFSLGATASYLFGNFENSRRSIFPGSSNSFNTRAKTTTRVSDLYFDYGAQYAYSIDSLKGRDLKEKVKILAGITFAAQTNVKARVDSLSYSYFNTASGFEVVKDTIENTQNTRGEITLPLSFGFGLGLKKGDKWIVAADFAIQNWSSYKAFNETQGLKNSMRVSLGAQYVPNAKSNKYLSRINYRIGGRYAKTALELKNTPLTEYAGSIGIGFPVGRNYLLQTFSMVNIGAEIGQRGTTTNGLIRENFFKVTIGFTINDRWFVKPKFD
ncbi:MAG: hypothetical protein ACT4ON_06470 [Bacteroidota bacterium]